MKYKQRLAIIGCGGAAEMLHAPAAARIGWPISIYIDSNLSRAKQLARTKKAFCAAGIDEAMNRFDAAIVSLPNRFHAPVSIKLLQAGKHVLVEKPMATTLEDATAMATSASESSGSLTIGLYRRFAHTSRWVKEFLKSGGLGRIISVDLREGTVFAWPVASNSLWSRSQSGGGVLLDRGAHALDLMDWWFGPAVVKVYRDDNYGGVEAEVAVELEYPGGIAAKAIFSRTRALRGTAVIEGERGRIEVGLLSQSLRADPPSLLEASFDGINGRAAANQTHEQIYADQLSAWHRSISGGPPTVSPLDGAGSVALMERCYGGRRDLDLPWVRPWLPGAHSGPEEFL